MGPPARISRSGRCVSWVTTGSARPGGWDAGQYRLGRLTRAPGAGVAIRPALPPVGCWSPTTGRSVGDPDPCVSFKQKPPPGTRLHETGLRRGSPMFFTQTGSLPERFRRDGRVESLPTKVPQGRNARRTPTDVRRTRITGTQPRPAEPFSRASRLDKAQ